VPLLLDPPVTVGPRSLYRVAHRRLLPVQDLERQPVDAGDVDEQNQRNERPRDPTSVHWRQPRRSPTVRLGAQLSQEPPLAVIPTTNTLEPLAVVAPHSRNEAPSSPGSLA
jgi:hypothetical protein